MAEIGIFFRVIIEQEQEDRRDKLTQLWMGSNLQYKGLQEVLQEMSNKKKIADKKEEVPIAEVNKDWRRLASFMRGQK